MKILVDSCVWGKTAEELRASGHDVVDVREWPHDPGDEQVLLAGSNDGRVVVTLDKDFGELAVLRGMKHRGIVRLVDIPGRLQAQAVLSVIVVHADLLARGGIVTVEPGRVRLREPLDGP